VGDNETWIYTGQVFDADGVFSFAEHIDDNVLVRVNGVQVLRHTAWDVPTFGVANGIPDDGDNWYDLEIRLGEGGGGQGPSGGGDHEPGWSGTYGFGFSPDLEADADGANYTAPVEPAGGGPTLFRTTGFGSADWTSAQVGAVGGTSTLDVAGNASSVSIGSIPMSNNSTLNVIGKSNTTIQNLSVATGTTSRFNANAPGMTVQNIAATGANLEIGGTLSVPGTVTANELTAHGPTTFAGSVTASKVTATGVGVANLNGTTNVGNLTSLPGGVNNVRSTLPATNTISTSLAGTINFDAPAGGIAAAALTGNQTNEGTVRFSAGTTTIGGAKLIASPAGLTEGLFVGYIDANMDLNGNPPTQFDPPGPAPNAFGGVQLAINHGQMQNEPAWVGDDETWIYQGQIFDADGVFSFAENIDDDVLIRVNGHQILRDAGWNTPTFGVYNNNVPDPDNDNWYDVDIRLGERGGGAGPAENNATLNWTTTYGFGFSPDAETDANGLNYTAPVEPAGGGPTLFRTFSAFGTIQVDAGATGTVAGFINHTRVNVEGRLNLTPNGTNAGTSSVNNLVIPGTGVLDIADNDMVIHSTPGGKDTEHAAIQAEIVSAQNGPDESFITKWDGPGLTSSSARAANVNAGFDLTALGVIRNSDLDVTTGVPGSTFTTFSGIAVTPDDILVKYTYTGDGNLDGAVTFDDYAAMDSAFFGLIPNLGWATGDINFDGSITFDDYSVVDQAFFFQGAPLAGEGGGVAAVPEPATWLMVVLGGLAGLFTWYRRK
jgi:hypothetical protein